MGGKTQQTTQQVQIPPEVLARYNSVNAQAQGVAGTPFQQYSSSPNAFVAPLTAEQNTGIGGVNQYANSAQPAVALGEAMTSQGSAAANPTALNQAAIQQYENPYTSYVTGQESALLNQQNQQAQAGQLGTAISSGAFGGDRSGIAAANLAGQQELAYGNVMAPILQQGYNTALSTAQQQQGVGLAAQQANLAREQAGGAQIAGLGQAGQQAGLMGAQAQMAAGQTQQQTEQAGLTALYNQFLQQQSYPFQTTQFLANIAEGTGALSGQTTNTTQPAPFFSDRRLKEDIKRIGTAKNGLPIHSFRFKDDPEKLTRIGFLADEVEKKHPEAVGLSGGFKTVDYEKAARPARYAGGLIPSSSGGVVTDQDGGGLYCRGGYDAGGYAGGAPMTGSPEGWASMLAAQEGMYGPKMGGLYGGDAGGLPHGGKSYVPSATLPQHQMLQPSHAPQQQPSTLSQLGQIGQEVKSLSGLGTAAKDVLKQSGLGGGTTPAVATPAPVQPPPQTTAPTVPADASAPAASAAAAPTTDVADIPMVTSDGLSDIPVFTNRGGLVGRGHFDTGGGAGSVNTTGSDSGDPEGLYQASTGLDIPDQNPQAKLPTVQSPSSQSSNGLQGVSGVISGLTALAGLFAAGGLVGDRRRKHTGGLLNEGAEFARGGLATGGDPDMLDPNAFDAGDTAAPSDTEIAAHELAPGLDPRADLRDSRHFEPRTAGLHGPDMIEPDQGAFGGLDVSTRPSDRPTAPVTSGLNAADLAASAQPGGLAGRAVATDTPPIQTSPDVPLPPSRPADLGTATPPMLAAQPEDTNPIVRMGNAVSNNITQGVAGAGRAVQGAGNAVSGAITGGINSILGREEGFRSAPYQDGKGGPLAIGYGSHNIIDPDTGHMRPVQPGDRISQPQATALMNQRLQTEFIPQAQKQIGGDAWNSLSQRAKDGITSVTYNYGHVPPQVVAAARTGDDNQIAAAIASLPANPNRRAREAAYVSGQDVYGGQKMPVGGRDFQANAADQGGDGVAGGNPVQSIAGGLGGVGQAFTDASQGAGNWFEGNKNWMIPLLTGLGTMASSNSRYLGSAMLQGLGGGAQAYAQQQASQANIAHEVASTNLTNIQTATHALENMKGALWTDSQGNPLVILADGTLMKRGDWEKEGGKRPILGGAQAAAAAARYGLTAAGGPTPISPAVAAPNSGAPPAAPGTGGNGIPFNAPPAGGGVAAPGTLHATPIAPLPVDNSPEAQKWGLGNTGKAQLTTSLDQAKMSPQNFAAFAPDSIKRADEVNAFGNVARAQGSKLNQLTHGILNMPDNGVLTGGPLNEFISPIVQRANQLASIAGHGAGSTTGDWRIFPDDVANGNAVNKMHAIAQFADAHGAGQQSFQAAELAGMMKPGTSIDKESATKVLEGLYRDNQQDIDRQNYHKQFRDTALHSDPTYGARVLSKDIDAAFVMDHPEEQYATEKQDVGRFLRAPPKNGHPLFDYTYGGVNGEKRPRLADAYTKNPGVSRYFTQQ